MKAVVFEEKLSRKYFLAYRGSGFSAYAVYKLDVKEELTNVSGFVRHEDEHMHWTELLRTDEYTREFIVGEKLNINGNNYEITSVSHAEDGTIHYQIAKKVIIADEESKEKAEEDLAIRKLILEERERLKKLEEIKQYKHCSELAITNANNHGNNKKWYKFWK